MKKFVIIFYLTLVVAFSHAQLTNTSQSGFAKLQAVGLSDVQFTKGFWAERFEVCKDSMVPHLWATYTSKDMCYAFENFRIAAGLDSGKFRGPSFHDGDFIKL
ncbi:MAG: hypothetical protein WDM90_06655 [Ferruginibacter sp.]